MTGGEEERAGWKAGRETKGSSAAVCVELMIFGRRGWGGWGSREMEWAAGSASLDGKNNGFSLPDSTGS